MTKWRDPYIDIRYRITGVALTNGVYNPQYIRMTVDQKITTPTKGLPGDRGHSEHGSMDKEHCCFVCSRGSICFPKSAPFIAHGSMLQFLVLSQDTLFLPDDSFFSLYRVFGVTEVFNEVLGDYYMSLS